MYVHVYLILFQGINWNDLAEKKVPAPFVPKVRNSADTKNFSSEFTMMDVTYSPAVVPVNGEKLFKVSDGGSGMYTASGTWFVYMSST